MDRREMRVNLPTVESKPRLVLFGASAAVAFVVGFVAVSPKAATVLIREGGYYYMLGLFAVFVGYAAKLLNERRAVWRGWLRAPGIAGAAIVGASAALLWMDPYKHKVLFDEYVLQGTAFHMHATKEIGTVIRAYDIQGTWLPIDTFLDKRPYFFTFLLSLMHDLTGYRTVNVYVMNSLFAPVCIGLLYWIARSLMSRGAALWCIALVGTLPLAAQQATGAGMELHNLAMLLLVTACAILYLRAPSNMRLSVLVTATVLLAQSRYESVIFVLPIAMVIAIGWWRAGRVLLPWPAIAAPLLLVPYAWHNRIVADTPMLWQLGEGQSARFSASYLAGNLQGAWTFFFDLSGALPNSWFLSAVGLVAIGVTLFRLWRKSRAGATGLSWRPEEIALAAVGSGIVANVVLLMFYYWSRFDDVVASRFALPFYVLLAMLAGTTVAWLQARRWPALRIAVGGLVIWLAGWGIPATAQRLYTEQNLVMQELEWERGELRKRDPSLLFITNKSTIPFVLWQIPAVINGQGRQRGPQIAYHLSQGTFREVIVAQMLKPTSERGEFAVAREDMMPPEFQLEPIAEKRFGARFARLSRVVGIAPRAAGPMQETAAGMRRTAVDD